METIRKVVKKKVLITGGCGYIGSQIALEMLRDEEFEPVSVDNFCNSTSTIPERLKNLSGKPYKNYNINLLDAGALSAVFAENTFYGVIHLAALKSIPQSLKYPLKYYQNNIISLTNVLHCCQEYNVRRLVFSSSCSVYGEEAKFPVDERTPVSPQQVSAYSNTKKVGEEIVRDFSMVSDIECIILRYFNPAGSDYSGLLGETPSEESGFIPKIVWRAMKGECIEIYGRDYDTRDGTCVRDFIHIQDLAMAHIQALSATDIDQVEVINVGSGSGMTVLEVAEALKNRLRGVTFEFRRRRSGDIPCIFSDNTQALAKLHWVPKLGLEEILDSQIKWTNTFLSTKDEGVIGNKVL